MKRGSEMNGKGSVGLRRQANRSREDIRQSDKY